MITICEPLCKGVSHEKFNSGFLYGLRLAFPTEAIRFYADITHINAIKSILAHDGVNVGNIEYIPIEYYDPYSPWGIHRYYSIIRDMFSTALDSGTDKIFFLSFSPTILHAIKKLKQQQKFKGMKFTLVLHGSFENIAEGYKIPNRMQLPIESIKNKYTTEIEYKLKIISQTSISDFPREVISPFFSLISPWQRLSTSTKLFKERDVMLWQHSDDYRYICLSPHIKKNAEQYIDTEEMNIHTVILPTVFAKPTPEPNNKHVKFAVFGYGRPLMLHNILAQLSTRGITTHYEIRIIGMDNRGTHGFPNVTCPSAGKRLDRTEMERYVKDIDMFLILYDKSQYRLSCTGSILEALSYIKPVLHFDNDCINTFNTPEIPIGLRCNNLDEYVDRMKDIIEKHNKYLCDFQLYRNNIVKLREKYSIRNSSTRLQESFTW